MRFRSRYGLGILPLSYSLVTCALTLWAGVASSQSLKQVTDCAGLSPKDQQIVRSHFEALHPYDGCDETFAVCLSRGSLHPSVRRSAADICRQVKRGKTRASIDHALSRRALSLLPSGTRAAIALDTNALAGEKGAKVVVAIYACARCPFCKALVPPLYDAVTRGVLKGKVRLYFRPFPIKDHKGSLEGGLAVVSAGLQGKLWPYVIHLYKNFDGFSPKVLGEWAQGTGLNRTAFEKALADPKTRALLVASKQEGVRNKVSVTPTLFINGRKYVYELSVDTIVDVLLESHEQI